MFFLSNDLVIKQFFKLLQKLIEICIAVLMEFANEFKILIGCE